MNTANLQNEGTVEYNLRPGPNMPGDWATNSDRYTFPPFDRHGISIQCVKHEDGTLEVEVTGVLGQLFVFRETLPEVDPKRLHVAVTWKHPEINLYLGGRPIKTLHAL